MKRLLSFFGVIAIAVATTAYAQSPDGTSAGTERKPPQCCDTTTNTIRNQNSGAGAEKSSQGSTTNNATSGPTPGSTPFGSTPSGAPGSTLGPSGAENPEASNAARPAGMRDC